MKSIILKTIIGLLILTTVGCKYKPTFGLHGIGLTRKDSNNQNQVDQIAGQIENLQIQDAELEARISALELTSNLQQAAINLLHVGFSDLQAVDVLMQNSINDIIDRLDNIDLELHAIDCDLDVVKAKIVNLQNQINALNLASSKNIVKVIDPCGDGVGFDEILLQLADGTIIAYFESGGDRHLSVLGVGSYRTTDKQKCFFKVDANGNVLD